MEGRLPIRINASQSMTLQVGTMIVIMLSKERVRFVLDDWRHCHAASRHVLPATANAHSLLSQYSVYLLVCNVMACADLSKASCKVLHLMHMVAAFLLYAASAVQ